MSSSSVGWKRNPAGRLGSLVELVMATDKQWRLLSSDVLAVGLARQSTYYTQFILLLTTYYCIDQRASRRKDRRR